VTNGRAGNYAFLSMALGRVYSVAALDKHRKANVFILNLGRSTAMPQILGLRFRKLPIQKAPAV